jgi:hypothetical protein
MSTPTLTWTFQADRLQKYADYLLDVVVQVLTAAGVDLPDRRLITVGTPVHDCEQLILTFAGLTNGAPGAAEEPSNCNAPITATFMVHLVRCFPTPVGRGTKAPEAEALTANAAGMMLDSWLLMQAANAIDDDPRYSTYGTISSVAVGEPNGGFVETALTIEAAVP